MDVGPAVMEGSTKSVDVHDAALVMIRVDLFREGESWLADVCRGVRKVRSIRTRMTYRLRKMVKSVSMAWWEIVESMMAFDRLLAYMMRWKRSQWCRYSTWHVDVFDAFKG